MSTSSQSTIGPIAIVIVSLTLAVYFCFSAIQGNYGVLRRAEITAEAKTLEIQLAQLQSEIAKMENRTIRLSDSYLDLDLLDQQARDVLGLIRPDEIVIK